MRRLLAVLTAIFLFVGALLQLLSQALSDHLVLLLHHRTTWSRLDSGTLMGAGILGTRSVSTSTWFRISASLIMATLSWGCPNTAPLLCAD
jgi:hypothetical protein